MSACPTAPHAPLQQHTAVRRGAHEPHRASLQVGPGRRKVKEIQTDLTFCSFTRAHGQLVPGQSSESVSRVCVRRKGASFISHVLTSDADTHTLAGGIWPSALREILREDSDESGRIRPAAADRTIPEMREGRRVQRRPRRDARGCNHYTKLVHDAHFNVQIHV